MLHTDEMLTARYVEIWRCFATLFSELTCIIHLSTIIMLTKAFSKSRPSFCDIRGQNRAESETQAGLSPPLLPRVASAFIF